MSASAAWEVRDDGVLRLGESVRVDAASAFRDACCAILNSQGPLQVDCSGTRYLDTSALQILAALARELRSRDRAMTLHEVGPELGGWLRLSGMSDLVIVTH